LDSINVKETSATPWDPIVYPIKSAIPVGAFLLWLQMTADVARKAYVALRGKEL
jgi:TRAP-type mannitol/chloroaromatic compound transport system permease small subunit